MRTQTEKTREYFARFLDTPEDEVDYRDIGATAAGSRGG
jgi:hypothetical protein